MAKIDKAIGLGKAIENRKKRSVSENQNLDTNKETQNIIKPNKTQLKQSKFYDGQYALLNELPTVWNFLKELWNGPKRAIKSEKKTLQGKINLSEIKPTEVENTQQTAAIETQTTNIVSDLVTRTNKIPEIIRGIENIEVGSNSTKGTSKPKYKFKCQYFCRIINVTTEATKINTTSHIPRITSNTEENLNEVMKTSKSTSRKYETTTFWKYNTQNEETTAETEFTPTTIETELTPITEMEETFPTSNPPFTDPQPIELDTSISEITTEIAPSVLVPSRNDKILITVRQPYRSTSLIWTSKKKGRIEVRWQIPFVDTDYSRTECMEGDKKCQDQYHWRKCWTIDGKKTCARLAMADEPAKTELEPLPELTMENAHKISTHQAFLILCRQRLEALFELFNIEIQKLKQSTTRIFEVFFRRSKYKRSTSLIPIVGELASRLFGLSTEEDLNILRDNVKRLNTAMNTTLHVQKIQASIANYQKDKIEAISKKISRTVNTMNYLKMK